MHPRALAVSIVVAALLPAQERVKPAKPALDGPQWNSAVGLGGGAGGKYGGRGGGRSRKGSQAAAIGAGLDWLTKAQHETGSWVIEGTKDVTVGVTSLAVLAIFGDGSTMRAGPHKEPVKKGIKWLREQQAQDGAFASATGPHMLATLAMIEAFHLSTYNLLKPTAMRGVQHLQGRRHTDGGWRASATAEDSDPVLTLWGASVLVTATDARLLMPEGLRDGVIGWMNGPRANAAPQSGVLGTPVPVVRQAELANDQRMANAFTRYWLGIEGLEGQETEHGAALERARDLARAWTPGKGRKLSINEWLCSSYALAQAGDSKAVGAIAKALAAEQVADGDEKGSWEPIGVWGETGGRVWTTAMAVLVLESPYRYVKGMLAR